MELKSINKSIYITKKESEISRSFKELSSFFDDILFLPTIEIVDMEDYIEFDEHLNNLSSFDYIIFTSLNSVKFFFKRVKSLKIEIDFTDIKIISTGKKTGNCFSEFSNKEYMVPEEYSANGILNLLSLANIEDKNFLIPSSRIARSELAEGLLEKNAVVKKVPIYDVVIPEKNTFLERWNNFKNNIDCFCFTSPSSFKNFYKILELQDLIDYFEGKTLAAIGKTTAEFIEDYGLKVDIVPETFTLDGLAKEIKKYYGIKN